jgi:hypothetical protein
MSENPTPLYVVCSPRTRVGKTLVSRLLTEFYFVDDRHVAAFDLADEGPQLVDYLPEITTVVDIRDIRGQVAFFRPTDHRYSRRKGNRPQPSRVQ